MARAVLAGERPDMPFAGGHGGGAVVFDPASEGLTVLSDDLQVSQIGFGRGGDVVVLVSRDGSVRLFDVERAESLGVVWDGAGVSWAEAPWYDPSTESVWVRTAGRLLQFPLDPAGWIERACELAGRNLTQAEWDEYVPGDETRRAACIGFATLADIEAGTYDIADLGVPVTLTLGDGWQARLNEPGNTFFAYDDARDGVRDFNFLRPTVLSDPLDAGGPLPQDWWLLDDIEGWIAALPEGVITRGPEEVEVGGRAAVLFEGGVGDDELCGDEGHCLGFVINTTHDDGRVSGYTFQPGQHQRVWWIDGGAEPPLVVIASSNDPDDPFFDVADSVVESLVVGEFGPHPLGG